MARTGNKTSVITRQSHPDAHYEHHNIVLFDL